MIVGFIIDFLAGLICIVLGLLLWKKQMISLLHSYHYKNVKKEDVPAYTRLMGMGIIMIGCGICATGFLNLIYSDLWWLPLVGGFVIGFIVLYRAQMKYNGSVF